MSGACILEFRLAPSAQDVSVAASMTEGAPDAPACLEERFAAISALYRRHGGVFMVAELKEEFAGLVVAVDQELPLALDRNDFRNGYDPFTTVQAVKYAYYSFVGNTQKRSQTLVDALLPGMRVNLHAVASWARRVSLQAQDEFVRQQTMPERQLDEMADVRYRMHIVSACTQAGDLDE